MAWGQKAFDGYLAGGTAQEGATHDATLLMRSGGEALRDLPILVDTGGSDNFLEAGQLQPETLVEAMKVAGRTDGDSCIRIQEGYDHSYFFIATFIDEHIAWHAKELKK